MICTAGDAGDAPPFWRVSAPEPAREGLSFVQLMQLAATAGDGTIWTTNPSLELLGRHLRELLRLRPGLG